MEPMVMTSGNFQTETEKGLTVVDFWAAWCGPCRMLAPTVDELAAQTQGVKFGKVNVDEEAGLAAAFGVQSIPTLVFLKDGREAGRITGVHPKAEIEKMIEALR